MTRGIKASEVREGMEVEWSNGGITYQMQCQRKVEFKRPFLKEIIGYNFCTEGGGVQYVDADQEVTVLKEAQPEEPTAFGACVEVGGVKYVRCDDDELEWKSSDGNGWWGWSDLCDEGHVTVINPDPFTNTEPREPRVWETWEDVPEMTPVRVSGTALLYRKAGDRIECVRSGSWVPSFADEYDLNEYSPFTEKNQ